MPRVICSLLVVCLATISLANAGWADERDAAFTAGLRRLQLFDLAERYCRQELSGQLTPDREAELTIELLRTLALQAISRNAAEREPLWQEARRVATDFQRLKGSHPQLLLIQVQDALTLLAQGETAHQEAEAAAADSPALAEAAEQLRQAAKALEAMQLAIAKEVPLRRGKSLPEEQLSAEELTRLALNVSLHLAKARRLQALCYPADSRDRKALLLSALDPVESAVSTLEADDELAGRLRVLQMACLRELGRLTEAHSAWKLIERDDVAVDVRRAGLAEAARLQLAARRPHEALALLAEERFAKLSAGDAEIDLVRLEAALIAAELAGQSQNTSDQTKWQHTAAALAQRIDQIHGRAAGRRADQLVTSLLPADAAGGNVDLLERMADNLYVKQQIEEALATYDKAAAAAHNGNRTDREYELRYKAALVEQQRRNFTAASARFERLAIELKTHTAAADAHLVACWNKAQQARSDPAAAPAYVEMLSEHAARWPQSPTANQAWLWLGTWHQAQQEWSPAFGAYSQVQNDSPHALAALEAAAEVARRAMAEKPTEKETRTILNYFTALAGKREPPGKSTTEPARVAALVAADLHMQHTSGGHATAEQILREALTASPEADSTWRDQANSLLVAALAGQSGRAKEAEELLESLASDQVQLLALLDRLAASSQQVAEKARRDLATTRLAVIDRLKKQSDKLSPTQRRQVERLRAAALADVGKGEEALTAYASLAKQLPADGAVQQAYAELLGSSRAKGSREAALAKWRQIAAKSPPRSERWCKSKYAIASLQVELGDKKSATTLCRYLLETPPGLNATGWEERFIKLLEAASAR